MTPEQQRIAIAEACGWKNDTRGLGWLNAQGEYADLPDYLNDLNAMYEAEDTMGDPQLWDEYNNQLASAMGWVGWLYHATAAQRAEAFLHTHNLWTP